MEEQKKEEAQPANTQAAPPQDGQRRDWLRVVSSILGGFIFTMVTISPTAAAANITGWLGLVIGLRLPPRFEVPFAALAILFGVATLVLSFSSLAVMRRVFGEEGSDNLYRTYRGLRFK